MSSNPAALYASLTTEELMRLREAHEIDRAHAPHDRAEVFCVGRIALITAELATRAKDGVN